MPQDKICHSLLSLVTSECPAYSDICTLRDTEIQKGLPRQSSPCATTQPLAFGKSSLPPLPTPADGPKTWESGSPPTHPHCFPGNIFPATAGMFVTWRVPVTLQTGFTDLIQFCDEVAHLLAFLGQTGF